MRAIVEERDASAAEVAITETNTGILAAPARLLAGCLERLGTDNAQSELYLTDVIGLAVGDGIAVEGVLAGCAEEVAVSMIAVSLPPPSVFCRTVKQTG